MFIVSICLREFLDVIESMGLEQHVKMPTHKGGHILDLLITREIDTGIISGTPRIGRFISDHAAVISHMHKLCKTIGCYREDLI